MTATKISLWKAMESKRLVPTHSAVTCPKLACSGVFIVSFEHISHLVLVFLLSMPNLNTKMPTGSVLARVHEELLMQTLTQILIQTELKVKTCFQCLSNKNNFMI